MRIGIDARELAGLPTGVGRYLSSILREWDTTAAAGGWPHDVVLYLPDQPDPRLIEQFGALKPGVHVVPGGGGTWWEQAQVPPAVNADRPDVFFAPAYTAPLRMGCPTVVTVHDLSYLAHPEWFRPRERWRRAIVTRAAARRATKILTDSAFSGREVERLIAVPRGRIQVVYLGLGLQSPASEPAQRLPLVLYVGSIFNRRRLPDLIRAFSQVVRDRPEARLEIVGEDRTWPAEDIGSVIRLHGLTNHVTLRAYVDDEQLAGLYARASVFAFLSEYEGFGLTPLEALARGVPPVVLDTPVAREIYDDAAVFVQHGDIGATAAAIAGLLDASPARHRILQAAARVLPRYSWPRTAAETLAAIESAAGTRRG